MGAFALSSIVLAIPVSESDPQPLALLEVCFCRFENETSLVYHRNDAGNCTTSVTLTLESAAEGINASKRGSESTAQPTVAKRHSEETTSKNRGDTRD